MRVMLLAERLPAWCRAFIRVSYGVDVLFRTRSFPPAVAVMLAEFPAAGLCREFVEWMVSEPDAEAKELAPDADPRDETDHVVIPSGAGESQRWRAPPTRL
jgi:hypothetical protein